LKTSLDEELQMK